jgi:hypothetical protein
VAGIGSSLKTRDNVRIRSKQVNYLAFSFIAPLAA